MQVIPLARQYWRCRRGTIFCGGRYYVRARLCRVCYQRRYYRGKRVPKNSTWRVPSVYFLDVTPRPKRGYRWGGELSIEFSGRMYADGKTRVASYARWLYERVAGPLPADLVVVALRNRLPQFEDLIVVRRDETRDGVARYLRDEDLRSGRVTPF